ncbi:MAG: pantoate--beta-alanine ligase [Bdellovibrionales bacterium]|nr:pantoate--beta-alanine ligase [Bdellovibrionales bacterium]
MRKLVSPKEVKAWRHSPPSKSLGFVPTMGALHEGHLSLIRKAKSENDQVMVSLFVNPTQFNDPKDFENYPKTLNEDLELLISENVDAVFLPTTEDLYPHGQGMKVTETEFSKDLCGEFRPGHFDGVLTVVMKLFQIVKPSAAYFGEKDYQQLLLIERMVKEFFIDLEIVRVPTLRETNGLAMSSRNRRLSSDEQIKASLLYKAMKEFEDPKEVQATLEKEGFRVEYVREIKGRRFVAAWLGDVRLIDNVDL